MKKTFTLILYIIIIISWSSCRDDFNFKVIETQLSFSKDTVYLDTVFTNIGSMQYLSTHINTLTKTLGKLLLKH